jgi:hypothetical protein
MAVYIFLPSQQKYIIYTLCDLCVSAVKMSWFRLCRVGELRCGY